MTRLLGELLMNITYYKETYYHCLLNTHYTRIFNYKSCVCYRIFIVRNIIHAFEYIEKGIPILLQSFKHFCKKRSFYEILG